MKYTCLFGGGAIRGTAHVGVIKALEKLDVDIDILGGSSVGSIVAALYAVDYSSEEISKIFTSVKFELFRDITLGFNQKFALSKGDIFLDWIRELIEQKYYGDKYLKDELPRVCFKDLNKKLVIITTNLNTFNCHEFSSFETPDTEIALAVRISCCMPGLMMAYNLNNELLVDGDLQKGKPMWSLSQNLKTSNSRILEIRLEGEFLGDDQNPINYINGMYSCITSNETQFIKDVYGKSDKYDYLVINTGNVVVIDFNYPLEKRQQIIDAGYFQTIDFFNNLVSKKETILSIYKAIFRKLTIMDKFFNKKKYKNVKIILGDIFIILSKKSEYIDDEIINQINNLEETFEKTVNTYLLGISICSDPDKLNNNKQIILKNLKRKIIETEDDIKHLKSKLNIK